MHRHDQLLLQTRLSRCNGRKDRMSRRVESTETAPRFTLLGGPLHRLACRLGLVTGQGNTVRLGLVLGLLPWLVLLLLALLQGLGDRIFSLQLIGGQVRLLVVIPLLFVCETLLDPRMGSFVHWSLRSRVVAPASLPALESEIARVMRWKDSWLPDAACLVATVILPFLGPAAPTFGITKVYDPLHAVAGWSLAAWWWWYACVPLARFLVLRWFVRFVLWAWFLWRVSRLDLNLLPDHPDRAGGLGGLETVHRYFAPLILALASIESASLAEEIVARKMVFAEIPLILAIILTLVIGVFLGPLTLFLPKLTAARLRGIRRHNHFAARYVQEFEAKWLDTDRPLPEPLLGSADIQSLADLDNTARDVRAMRIVPVSPRIVSIYVMAVIVPMLPLLLLQYPIAELAAKFVRSLAGL
jgi:hypothetical protein